MPDTTRRDASPVGHAPEHVRRHRGLALALSLAAVAVTGLLWAHDAKNARARVEADASYSSRKPDFERWNRPLGEGRCAIDVARFGGTRARLVRVESNGTIHFAVIEMAARPSPLGALQQGDWLLGKFGTAPTVTLGHFGSTAAALNRASHLCPPALRCLPGRPGCEDVAAKPADPLELFLRPHSPEIAPKW